MKDYNLLMNDILGQLYQEERLRRCLLERIKVHPDRMDILHYVLMNLDGLSKAEIKERAYLYGQTIEEEDLLARQIFLCLLCLADM